MLNQVDATEGPPGNLRERLSAPELRQLVERFVQRRVPTGDVEDVVQTVFVDALAASNAPSSPEDLRKWLVGITRHKVADFHRRGRRVRHVELPDELEEPAPSPAAAREWVEWAERKTAGDPDAARTLGWMAREGAGEKLAHIAEDEQLPATQIRQRVSRMRRWMKREWAAELAAVAAIVLLALVAWRWLREPEPVAGPEPEIIPDGVPVPPLERARLLRGEAVGACAEQQFQECLDKLDEAAGLDPAGDGADDVQALRRQAEQRLAPAPLPSAVPSALPSPTLEPSAKVPSIPVPTESIPVDKPQHDPSPPKLQDAPIPKKPTTSPTPGPQSPKPSLPTPSPDSGVKLDEGRKTKGGSDWGSFK